MGKFIKRRCQEHLQYQGKREPRISCITCWQYYVYQEKSRWQQETNEAEYNRIRIGRRPS